jgi:hypothetical protein
MVSRGANASINSPETNKAQKSTDAFRNRFLDLKPVAVKVFIAAMTSPMPDGEGIMEIVSERRKNREYVLKK